MGNAQSAYLSVSHANDKARKKRAERLANSWGGKMQMKSPQMKYYVKKREKKLKKGADLRKAQEEDETKGERYELGREHREQPRTNSKEENYVLKIKEYAIDQEKRDALLTELLVPDTDGYYVCLVGWTRMNKDEVANAGREARAEFGEYSLLRNNCQDFLRQLADKILIGDKAADYDWFRSNTKTKYQKDQWLLPPPAEMMLRMLENMQQMQMQQQQHQMHHMQMHSHQQMQQQQQQQQMQQQMQMQMQQQIQQQIQMQIQNQIQMQMPGMGGAGA